VSGCRIPSTDDIMPTPQVVLVCMPWAMATRPSIALGILKSLLDGADISCLVRSYHLGFAEYMARHGAESGPPIALSDYDGIAENLTHGGGGDWCFDVPPYRPADPERDRAYLEGLRPHASASSIGLLRRVRGLVPGFLRACADEIAELAPRVVGFTSTFCQNIPSLVLARMIKERLPDVAIVFGGSNCDAEMGAALHRNFPWVDVVVRGEGERVFPRLVEQLLAGQPLDEQPGLCFRRGGEVVHVPEGGAMVPLEEVPAPNYDEYFDRVASGALDADLRASLSIPIEAARGCWWGAKHHCTFCGLNGRTMTFRSKSPARVLDEIRQLAARHHCLDFFAVDNIIDMAYFQSVLPALRESGWNLNLFFETKANLKRAEVKALAQAGVKVIQPGIESLSSPVLALMRKGVTALVNIRLLKLCAEYDVVPRWNLLYAFPGEAEQSYADTFDLIPSLLHLYPPGAMGRLRVDRFSPYFVEREKLGMRVTGPKWFYRHLYDVDEQSLFDLAYFFDGEPTTAPPGRDIYDSIGAAVDRWLEVHPTAYRSLRYRVGPDFLVVTDQRPGMGPALRYVLDDVEARIYLACDAGASPASIVRALGPAAAGMTAGDVREFLDELVAARLVYREGDRYLGLAVAEDPTAVEKLQAGIGIGADASGIDSLVSLRRPGRGALTDALAAREP
jgi:ribosomal peptide maturation radical SAM protein 1